MLNLWLIIFSVEDDVPIDSEVLLMIDFINKIKLTQSFRYVHRSSVCVCSYMSICIYTVFLKKLISVINISPVSPKKLC
jgi:hypothetical protein